MNEDDIERRRQELEKLDALLKQQQSNIKENVEKIRFQNVNVANLDRKIKVKLDSTNKLDANLAEKQRAIDKYDERIRTAEDRLHEYEAKRREEDDKIAEYAAAERRSVEEELRKRREVVAKQEGDVAALAEAAARDRQFLDAAKSQLAAAWEEFERQRAAWRNEVAATEAEQREQLRRQAIDQQRREKDAGARLDGERQEWATNRRALELELRKVSAQREDLAARFKEVEQERDDLRERWRKVGGGSPEEVLQRLQTEEDKVKLLQEQVARLQYEIVARASAEAKRVPALEKELSEARQTSHQLQTIIDAGQIAAATVETLRRKEEWLKAKSETLEHIIREQSEQLNELKARTKEAKGTVQRIKQGTEAFAQRAGDIEAWEEDALGSTVQDAAEGKWLGEIEKGIENSGLKYSRRLLDSFHTSLKIAKWSPITVLSGVSGTGKSALPQLYARFGGFHFESVPVQPNWDSPQDAFGFFNYMENRFAARPLLRRMAQSQSDRSKGKPGFAGEILLVLLDEMNLARIELYLSDLLSRWELRRGEEKPVRLEFDLGPDCEAYSLVLGTNMLFTGTINEDESTQGLSDKLLDRGNLLYFPRPDSLKSRARLKLADAGPPLAHKVWESWCREPPSEEKEHPLLFGICNGFRQVTENMNRCLGAVDRALGHRVWQAMELYIVNNPNVAALRDTTRNASPTDVSASEAVTNLRKAALCAFEDQVVQRVVPKLRGLPLEGATRKYLDELAGLITTEAPGVKDDFQAALRPGMPSFVWRQSSYLK